MYCKYQDCECIKPLFGHKVRILLYITTRSLHQPITSVFVFTPRGRNQCSLHRVHLFRKHAGQHSEPYTDHSQYDSLHSDVKRLYSVDVWENHNQTFLTRTDSLRFSFTDPSNAPWHRLNEALTAASDGTPERLFLHWLRLFTPLISGRRLGNSALWHMWSSHVPLTSAQLPIGTDGCLTSCPMSVRLQPPYSLPKGYR